MDLERARARAGILGLVAVALVGCRSDPVSPGEGGIQAESVYIEVRVTGGFAGVDYTYAIVGEASELRGIACASVCDFEPGERLMELTSPQVLYFAQLLADADIEAYDGTAFGSECCDQFHYAVAYREGEREATVSGDAGTLPESLSRAVEETHQLLSGRLPAPI